jgi:hypothetical protein
LGIKTIMAKKPGRFWIGAGFFEIRIEKEFQQ